MGGSGGCGWRRAAKRIGFPCASLVRETSPRTISSSAAVPEMAENGGNVCEESEQNGLAAANKSLCPICLDPLTTAAAATTATTDHRGNSSSNNGQSIFVGDCSHSFHEACIASNVRHGSVTCPVCRALWTRLPTLKLLPSDPVFRILDASIASYRLNRRHIHYRDDDPVDPAAPRLHLALLAPAAPAGRRRISAVVSPHPPVDLVLVATPDGRHVRLLKQAAALAALSLGPADRLSVVVGSARTLSLRRMSPAGHRAALHAIDRLSSPAPAAAEGIRKAAKILDDRAHRNPAACVLHLSDGPVADGVEVPVPVHRFHVGFRLGSESNGLVMHEMEGFLERVLGGGGGIREAELRIDGGERVRLGEVRGGEERMVEVDGCGCGCLRIGYSYVEGGTERRVTGEVVVDVRDKDGGGGGGGGSGGGRRRNCIERWDYLDPSMARRWAKHLHGQGYKG